MTRAIALAVLLLLHLTTPGARAQDTLQLELERAVRLNGGGVYNLSGLSLGSDGYLYFTDDNGPAPIGWTPENGVFLRIAVDKLLDPANAEPELEVLRVAGEDSSYKALAEKSSKAFKYDLEGVTVLGNGKLLAIDERDRWLLEYDPKTGSLRQLAGYRELADWNEQMAGAGINTGFEGIAATDGKLFLAHEMFPNFIVRYSIDGGAFKPDTIINIPGSSDITGLEYEGGSLYALGRTGSHVYKLDPVTGAVKAVAAFGREADNPAYRFEQPVDYYRNSEGLAVGRGRVFIVLDGNFKVGLADQNERRPLILIYKRPAGF